MKLVKNPLEVWDSTKSYLDFIKKIGDGHVKQYCASEDSICQHCNSCKKIFLNCVCTAKDIKRRFELFWDTW